MIRIPFISTTLVLALFACSKPDPVDKAAPAASNLPEVNTPAPSASGEPHVATTPAGPLPAAVVKIPAALQGRWGLTPVDCMPGRDDAKGLLVITPGDLRFYESRAVPVANVIADEDSIAGNFAYTGEGQSWTKYQSLKVDKQIMVRTESNPTASFSYAKCG